MPTTTEQKKLVKKGEKEDFPEPSKKPICENSSNVDDENPKIMFVNKSAKLELPPVFSDEFFVWKRTFWQRKFDECEIKRIVAPMVDQSELAFRMFMRENGAHLCYTPMIHAHLFAKDPTYRKTSFSTVANDRPLIVQFCANNPEAFLNACRLVEGYCDGVDLNLGCPQTIARRGFYGAFLQESPDLIVSMVSAVYRHCRLPVSVKIRRLETIEQTISYAKSLEKAGASLLAIHGRTREQKGVATGAADWSYIRAVKQALQIPVVANGNIQFQCDVDRCLAETGTNAVMSAEGVLSNPKLFASDSESRPQKFSFCFDVAREYLHLAERYRADWSAIRAHVFRICHYSFLKHPDLRQINATVFTFPELHTMLVELEKRCRDEMEADNLPLAASYFNVNPAKEVSLFERVNSLPHYVCKPYVRPAPRQASSSAADGSTVIRLQEENEQLQSLALAHASDEYRENRRAQIEKLSLETGLSKKSIKKREKRKREMLRTMCARQKYPVCVRCSQPGSQACDNRMCRHCCKFVCKRLLSPNCKTHCFRFEPNKEQSSSSIGDDGSKVPA